MVGSRGKVDEIIGAYFFPLPFNFHNCFPFEYQEGLLNSRMRVRVGLTSILNLAQDHFYPIRTKGSRTEEAAICSPGVTRRRIGRQIV
jgi:hypothetical protein